MTAPRILYAGLFHETHALLDTTTPPEAFTVLRGEAILAKAGDDSPTDGFLAVARESGWRVQPILHAHATPGGPAPDGFFEDYWREFVALASTHLEAGVDAIFLVLHGAMSTATIADVEGEFLTRLRALPGAATVPVFGILDLHANVSARMARHANALLAYRRNPHTDARATAVHAARDLHRALTTGQVPRMAWIGVPVVWPPPGTGSDDSPLRDLLAHATALDGHDDLWAANVCPGFSFGDHPDVGVSASAYGSAPAESLLARLQPLAEEVWQRRHEGLVRYPEVATVLAQTPPSPRGPILLVEPADNIGGGAPGDGTGVLRAMLVARIERGLVVINDPQAVQALADLAPGQTRTLAIGGRGWRGDPGPVELPVTFVNRSDGHFELEDPHSHLASMQGRRITMGPCAVVRHAGVTILLTSRKTPPFDLGQFRSQGIEPRDFAYIGVKAAVAHRQAYDPITAASHWVETPGPCASDLPSLPHRHRPSDTFPWRDDFTPCYRHEPS